MATKAILLLGLAFGDEGKGSVCDALVRKYDATLVVRFNGGAQAGHRVITPDAKRHIFSQFGSGTFGEAATLLSRYMLVNPLSFLSEAKALVGLGLSSPKVYVEREALVTTPFHIAANRIRETLREDRHGSCGMGIGETMDDWQAGKESLQVASLEDEPKVLRSLLTRVKERKEDQLQELMGAQEEPLSGRVAQEWSVFTNPKSIDRVVAYYGEFRKLVTIVDRGFLAKHLGEKNRTVVFEGAQGVLLDQDFGFQPHTTWTNCTFDNALGLLEGIGVEVQRLGVLRAYSTRHGNGPFPTENDRYAACSAHDHNIDGEWQGAFRSGPLDLVLARYALDVVGGVDGLVMTNLDRLSLAPTSNQFCTGYRERDGSLTTQIEVCRPADLFRQTHLALHLANVQPVYETLPLTGDPYAHAMADRLGVPLAVSSHGATAGEKHFVQPALAKAV